MPLHPGVFFASEIVDPAPEAGFYTWDITQDILYGDTAIATLFGLDSADTQRGLPLADYIERIHPADRQKIARAISDTVIAGVPQQECYRVLGHGDHYVLVMSYGRCFRDRYGDPVLFSGIIIPTSEVEEEINIAH
jgi:PAS domain-containing protein